MSGEAAVGRLRRLLFLLSYVARQGEKGMPVERACQAAGFPTERELYDAIRFVNLIGPPGGTPDEFLEVQVENGRVYVAIPAAFARPPRLSFAEAGALLAAAGPLRHCEGDALSSALSKLLQAVPEECRPALEEQARLAGIQASQRSRWHALLDDALARRREVTLRYFSPARGWTGPRRVEPRLLFTQSGRWYLAARSVRDGEEKLYRLDRILEARLGTRCFAEPGTPGSPGCAARGELFADAARHPEVEVRFSPRLARLAHEQFGPLACEAADGSVTVKTRMASEAWAVSWALGYGGAVRIIRPAAWQRSLQRRARELLALHREKREA